MCDFIIEDKCLYHLYMAEKYMNQYDELSPYKEIFEAKYPDIQDKIDKNEKAKNGAFSHIKAAARALLNAIKNLIDKITGFITGGSLSKDEKALYKEFKARCAKDPTLKDKKITVNNFKQIYAEYNRILKDAEEADRKLAEGQDVNIDSIFNDVTKFCKGAASGFIVSVGCETAINFASSSKEAANKILSQLKNDQALQQKIIDSIGKKEAKKFQREIKMYGKRVSLRRSIMEMRGKTCTSLEDSIKKTNDEVQGVIGAIKDIKDRWAPKETDEQRRERVEEMTQKMTNNKKTLDSVISSIKSGKSDVDIEEKLGLSKSQIRKVRNYVNIINHNGENHDLYLDLFNEIFPEKKNFIQSAKDKAETTKNIIKTAKDGVAIKNNSIVKRSMGNKELKNLKNEAIDTVKDMYKVKKRADKDAKNAVKAEKRAIKASRHINNQSIIDSIMGVNDPNSKHSKREKKKYLKQNVDDNWTDTIYNKIVDAINNGDNIDDIADKFDVNKSQVKKVYSKINNDKDDD